MMRKTNSKNRQPEIKELSKLAQRSAEGNNPLSPILSGKVAFPITKYSAEEAAISKEDAEKYAIDSYQCEKGGKARASRAGSRSRLQRSMPFATKSQNAYKELDKETYKRFFRGEETNKPTFTAEQLAQLKVWYPKSKVDDQSQGHVPT